MNELSSAEAALTALHPVLHGIAGDDLHLSTPCPGFDVAALGDRLVGTITMVAQAAGAGVDAPNGNSPATSSPPTAAVLPASTIPSPSPPTLRHSTGWWPKGRHTDADALERNHPNTPATRGFQMTDIIAAPELDGTSAAFAENRTTDVEGDQLLYRRIGTASGTVPPLVMLQHFRGNLDYWDPLLLDTLATDREVITVDLAGVGGSGGRTPDTVSEMARNALGFIEALGS
jgi:hypothetical protein